MVVWLHGGVFLLRMLVRNLCLGLLLCLALPALAAEEVRVGAYHFPPYMVKPESAEPVGLDNAEFKTLLVTEAKMLSGLIKEAKINID